MSQSGRPIRAAVLVVSDRISAGTHEDSSGREACRVLTEWGGEIVHYETVSDDQQPISERILHYADRDRLDLVVTSGGTGFAERDVTPEATRGVIVKEAPGLAELIRRETARFTPFAALGRGVCGIRGKTLIVNLPGNPRGVVQCLEVLKPLVPHAVRVLRGEPDGHPAAQPLTPDEDKA